MSSSPAGSEFRPSLAVPIGDPSRVGEARRAASALAEACGFDATARGRVEIVVNEFAKNLLKHAGTGTILLRRLTDSDVREPRCGVEILSLDKGPGIADLPRAMKDGFSTAGSPGTGLGAVERLSETFDVYSAHASAHGRGTVMLSQLWSRPAEVSIVSRPVWDIGAVSVPVQGETESGDGWAFATAAGVGVLLVVDGLGHGPVAAEVAREALRVFGESFKPGTSIPGPGELLNRTHDALRKTRGGAVAIGILDPLRREIRFAGVGNISASVAASGVMPAPPASERRAVAAAQASRSPRSGLTAAAGRAPGGGGSMVSHNGTVGAEIRKVQEFVYPWPKGAAVIMHSDGIATHWNLATYPGVLSHRASVIAGLLYRDHNRGRDDATVVMVREGGGA